jgi:hypothetical protein
MGEFLREASIGSIVLVAVGAVLAIFVSPWLHVAGQRRKNAPAVESAGGPPVFVKEGKPFFSNPTARAVLVDVLGWALVGLGLALWIFD